MKTKEISKGFLIMGIIFCVAAIINIILTDNEARTWFLFTTSALYMCTANILNNLNKQ